MKLIFILKSVLAQTLVYKLIVIFHLTQYIKCDCNKSHPILKNNECGSIYCSPEDYNSSTCIVNNSIVKIQWLTNIIQISELKYRYIHPFLTKNKDLIIQTTSVLGTAERRYYGLTNEGRYYFINSKGEETPFYSIEVKQSSEDEFLYKYEGTAASIQFENDDNDYFLSVGNSESYIELIDHKRNTLTRILSKEFYLDSIVSEISSIFPITIKSNDTNVNSKYYFLSFLTFSNDIYHFVCKIYVFNSTDIAHGYKSVANTDFRTTNRKISSCFQSPTTNYIFCFYQNILCFFYIIVLEPNFELETKQMIEIDIGEYSNDNENIFYKGVYLINNVGFYLYYNSISSNPQVAIKEWDGGEQINDYNFQNFILDKFNFSSNFLYNDLININTNQICFTSVSTDKKILYITIFYFYNEYTIMVIRYYSIKLYELYHKKILFDLRISAFGNFLSLTSSFCSNYLCDSNSNDHYSYLIIFSYPNSTDIDFDLIQYLKKTNDNINNINIAPSNYKNIGRIENNIFGYYEKGFKILSIPENIKIFSGLSNTEIKGNYSLLQNENVSISISIENQTIKDEYLIKFALIVSEPEYKKLNDYIEYIDISKGDDNEKSYYTPKEYVGKTTYFKIIKDGLLSKNCEKEECSLCKEGESDKCITCNYDFTLIKGEKICKPPPITTIPSFSSIIMTSTLNSQSSSFNNQNITSSSIIFSENIKTEEIKKWSNEQILDKNSNEIITDEQILMIHKELTNILNNNYTNENIIVLTKNVIFQLSTLDDEKKETLENILISNVDIGECEKLIRIQENLKEEEDLIILKTDIKSANYKATYVQYEIYTPNKTKVDLKVCQNTSIYINIPIHLSQEIESLYISLNESGYNLFNSNDSFYNDVCTPYTSEKGIDIPIFDRQKEIYNDIKDYTICQNNCTFLYYNSTIKKSKCDCKVQIEETITDTELINFKDELFGSFYTTLKFSNFLVLKCFKLTFSAKGQSYNIGSYIMIIIFLILIILTIIHYITASKKLYNIMEEIILQKKNLNKIDKKQDGKLEVSKVLDTEIRENNKKKSKIQKPKLKNNIFKSSIRKSKNIKNKKLSVKIGAPPKQKKIDEFDKRSSFIINNSNSKNKIIDILAKDDERKFGYSVKLLKHVISKKDKDKKILKKSKFHDVNNNERTINNQKVSTLKKSFPYSSSGLIKIHKKKNFNKIMKYNNIKNFTNHELNRLEYDLAIDFDKRTYCQYYYSLFKVKHLILFTFFSSDDYNLLTIKISLFLLAFSLYFTINGFFFTDETMHNIYINNGTFQILYQIPLILYSSIITAFINSLLKYLSLTENTIIKLKKENNIDIVIQKTKKQEKVLMIKFIFFYICNYIFMSFFWYFLSCFCAVYKNTQIILIKDTLMSFALSMLYPLGLNLIPGLFRIPALRSPKRDKKCLYKFSNIVALI